MKLARFILLLLVVALCVPIRAAVNSTTTWVQYVLSTNPQTLTVPFVFQNTTDVWVQDSKTSPPVTLTQNSDYTVTGGNGAAGTVVMMSGGSHAVQVGDIITISRKVPLTQLTNYTNTGPLTAAMIGSSFDKLTEITQQLNLVGFNSLQFPGDETLSGILPKTQRAGNLLGFSANGSVQFYPLSALIFPTIAPIQASSIAALKAVPVTLLPNGYQIPVSGYYAPSDGGGGLYVYNALSAATDNGGTVIAPTAGSGRWLLQWFGPLSVRQFGAVGDGTTDDSAAIQATINAALVVGAPVHVPPGNFKLKNDLTAYGSLNIYGDGTSSIIDGSGHLYMSDPAKDLAYGLTILSLLDSTTYTASGTIAAGTATITLNSVSGLSVGSEIFLRLEEANTDPAGIHFRMFANITNISGTTVTLDNPVPENITGTDHQIFRVLTPARNVAVRNLTFHYFHLSIQQAENYLVEDITINGGPWFFGPAESFNGVVQRIYVENLAALTNIGPASLYGWFIQGYALYNLTVRDVNVRDMKSLVFLGVEAESRGVRAENVYLGLDCLSGYGSSVSFIYNTINTSSIPPPPLEIKNITFDFLSTGHRYDCSGQYVRLENMRLVGASGSDPVPNLLWLPTGLRGWLMVNNDLYSMRVPFRAAWRIGSGSGTKTFDTGRKGYLTSVHAYVGSLTGVTGAGVYRNGATESFFSLLAAAQFSPPANIARASNGNDQVGFYATVDGTQNANTMFLVEGDYLVAPSVAQTNADMLFGAGAPSANALFVGQQYLDTTGNVLYESTAVGSGASDWVALSP